MCIFNCGFCVKNAQHICRNCGACDSHRTVDCSNNKQKYCSPISITTYSIQSPVFVSSIASVKSPYVNPISNTHTINKSSVQQKGNATLTIFFTKNNKLYVIVGKRSFGRNENKIFSLGGSIESYETPEEAAAREAFEESGIKIDPKKIKLLNCVNNFYNYYTIFDYEPSIKGGLDKHVSKNDYVLDFRPKHNLVKIPVDILIAHFNIKDINKEDKGPYARVFFDILKDLNY
jgi:8-oxo-dGTP pyrophosphatase MutT (NUDIX family)